MSWSAVMGAIAMTVAAQAGGPVPEIIPLPPPEVAGEPVEVPSFKDSEYVRFLRPGGNVLSGDALLRTRGGQIRTCAGLNVELWPWTKYTADYFRRRFGSELGGYLRADAPPRRFTDIESGVRKYVRSTMCNAQGAFEFSSVPDGVYMVMTSVTWEIPGSSARAGQSSAQGGELAELVVLGGDKRTSVTLTQ